MFEIPKRIGHNKALDAAVESLVHAHVALVNHRNAIENADSKAYLRAVQALQGTLGDRGMWRVSETLCAAVLLGLVEVSFIFRDL